jgi:hypothetical protein
VVGEVPQRLPPGTRTRRALNRSRIHRPRRPACPLRLAPGPGIFQPAALKILHSHLSNKGLRLRAMVGAHRTFEPFYPNFPAQVMGMTEAELYFIAIRYHWSGERRRDEQDPRPPLGGETEVPRPAPRHPRRLRDRLHTPGEVEIAVLAAGQGRREVVGSLPNTATASSGCCRTRYRARRTSRSSGPN